MTVIKSPVYRYSYCLTTLRVSALYLVLHEGHATAIVEGLLNSGAERGLVGVGRERQPVEARVGFGEGLGEEVRPSLNCDVAKNRKASHREVSGAREEPEERRQVGLIERTH